MTADSKGWDFDKDWARKKCRVHIDRTGDFPFYVDVLTFAGWTTLFSGFRLSKDTKVDPWVARPNPAPLFAESPSLDLLCNFDRGRYLDDNPAVKQWLVGAPENDVWALTSLMLDYIVVYIAASLARYYTPAWSRIVEANQDDIYNDIRAAYRGVAEGFALFFEDEYPFQYSYQTRIPPY